MQSVQRERRRLESEGWDMETTFMKVYMKQYATNRKAERTGEKVECIPCRKNKP